VVHDYARLELSLKAHPLQFFRDRFAARGAVRAADLERLPTGRRLELAGLVLVRQRPGSARGVIFITLEDETGASNLIVWPKVFERFRPVVLAARLLYARGRLQKEGKVIHLVADELCDYSHLLAELTQGQHTLSGEGLARADEVRGGMCAESRAIGQERRDARAARAAKILPKSRDFH
jgi:error-prone DNA polymerase